MDAFERALELTPEGHPERPDTLARFGEAAQQAFRLSEAIAALEEATDALRVRGEGLAAARAMRALRSVLLLLNDPRYASVGAEALALLEPLPPGPELFDALADVAADATIAGRPEEGFGLAERALAIAADAGLPRPARALAHRGGARCVRGDAEGLEDYREALALAIQAGQGHTAALVYGNLAIDQLSFEGPRASLETFQEGLDFAEGRGMKEMALWLETNTLTMSLWAGELERPSTGLPPSSNPPRKPATSSISRTSDRCRPSPSHSAEGLTRPTGCWGWLEAAARRSGRPDITINALAPAAMARAALGQFEAARAVLVEIGVTPDLEATPNLALFLPAVVRAAIAIGEPELAGAARHRLSPASPDSEDALIAVHAALAEASPAVRPRSLPMRTQTPPLAGDPSGSYLNKDPRS